MTSFVYDGVGNVRKQVAHLPDNASPNLQETKYVYGVTTGGSSLINSNDLLAQVQYPDESTGLAGGSAYQVNYTYNRLGELRTYEDQNDTKHSYERDEAGRVALDHVTAFGTNIDQWIEAIGATYDDFGRLLEVTSYSDYTDETTNTVKNQVELAYTKLWQVKEVYQDHDGAVAYDGSGVPTGNGVRVRYAYGDADVDAGNFSRQTSMTYPDGAVWNRYYGGPVVSSGSIDMDISRATALRIDGGSTDPANVKYGFIGLDIVGRVDYPIPDVQLDRTVSHEGKRRYGTVTTQSAGIYPGLDKFGRVKKHAWVDGAYTTHATSSTVPNVPPIVELDYTYDRAGNRLTRTDARSGASWTDRDFQYAYDGLDRLTQADRGVAGGSWTAGVGGQKWALDMLGNWDDFWQDASGDGTYATGEKQDRSHNAANEVTAITGATFGFGHDAAGNMTESPNSNDTASRLYTHDAWNRLTESEIDDTVTTTTVGQYEYNGLHWRTVKRSRTAAAGSGLDEERRLYYSASWQLLQDDVDNDYATQAGVNERMQTFWGLRYIDEPIVRRVDRGSGSPIVPDGTYEDVFYHLTDAQYSTVAMLLESNAAVWERVEYGAYGKADRHHWGADADGDGDIDLSDQSYATNNGEIDGNPAGYKVEADFNRDGVITVADKNDAQAIFGAGAKAALANQLLSDASGDGPDNSIGYDGYVFNAESLQYIVRFRHYDPVLGRWLERDPVGYIGGINLYGYVRSCPINLIDPAGLQETVVHPGSVITEISIALEQAGWTQAEIIKYLISKGFSQKLIESALGISIGYLAGTLLQEIIDQAQKAVDESIGQHLTRAEEIWKKGGCPALQAVEQSYCKPSPKGCKHLDSNTKNCNVYKTRAAEAAACAGYRIAVDVLCKQKSDPAHYDEEVGKETKKALTCMTGYIKCLIRNQGNKKCSSGAEDGTK